MATRYTFEIKLPFKSEKRKVNYKKVLTATFFNNGLLDITYLRTDCWRNGFKKSMEDGSMACDFPFFVQFFNKYNTMRTEDENAVKEFQEACEDACKSLPKNVFKACEKIMEFV